MYAQINERESTTTQIRIISNSARRLDVLKNPLTPLNYEISQEDERIRRIFDELKMRQTIEIKNLSMTQNMISISTNMHYVQKIGSIYDFTMRDILQGIRMKENIYE